MTCRVLSCKNVEKETIARGLIVQFYEFPNDPDLNSLWTKMCGMVQSVSCLSANPPLRQLTLLLQVKGKDWICSDHFVESDYNSREISIGLPFRKWKLKRDAVPSVNLPVKTEKPVQMVTYEVTHVVAATAPILVLTCRACSKEVEGAKFENLKWLTVRSLFEECTSLQVSEAEATWQVICSKCLGACKAWKVFKRMCIRSDRTQKALQSSVQGWAGVEAKGEDVDPLALGDFQGISQSEADSEQESEGHQNDPELVHEQDQDIAEVAMENEQQSSPDKKDEIIDSVQEQSIEKPPPPVEQPIKEDEGEIISNDKPTEYENEIAPNDDGQTKANPESFYQCAVCSKCFRSQYAIRQHSYVHTGERPYPCHLCDKKFKDGSNRRRHVLGQHSTPTNWPCSDCTKKFRSKSFLSLHKKKYHSRSRKPQYTTTKSRHSSKRAPIPAPTPSPLECTQCKMTFANTAERILHLATHLKANPKPFKCQHCEKDFHKAVELKIHEATYHQKKTVLV